MHATIRPLSYFYHSSWRNSRSVATDISGLTGRILPLLTLFRLAEVKITLDELQFNNGKW